MVHNIATTVHCFAALDWIHTPVGPIRCLLCWLLENDNTSYVVVQKSHLNWFGELLWVSARIYQGIPFKISGGGGGGGWRGAYPFIKTVVCYHAVFLLLFYSPFYNLPEEQRRIGTCSEFVMELSWTCIMFSVWNVILWADNIMKWCKRNYDIFMGIVTGNINANYHVSVAEMSTFPVVIPDQG